MKELIKAIRLAAKMNQEKFADVLGTTVLSVNRWENGKTEPNKMAQKQIVQFCRDEQMDMSHVMIGNREYPHNSEKIILYHGSRKGIEGDIAPISREECDFGKGFYMGTNVLQPLTLVCSENKPKFYTMEFNLTGLNVLQIEVGLEWALLIAYYRKEMNEAKGTRLYEKYAHFLDGYDVVVGYIANDRMYTELSRFFNKTLTDEALIQCLSALDLGKQYVAISEKACKQIKIIKEETLKPLELSLLMDMSTKRRKEGISQAEKIEMEYRREGRYLDEILRGGI